MAPAIEAPKLDLKRLARLKILRQRMLGELTAPVNDPRQAARHDVENRPDAGEQEDRRERELDGMRHVSGVGYRLEHGGTGNVALRGLPFAFNGAAAAGASAATRRSLP